MTKTTLPYEGKTTYVQVLSRRFAVSLHEHDDFHHAIITEYTIDPAGRTNSVGAMLANDCTHCVTTHSDVASYPENIWQLGMLCVGELVFCDDRLEDMANSSQIPTCDPTVAETLKHLRRTIGLVKANTTEIARP
jgi:hypothetical protein